MSPANALPLEHRLLRAEDELRAARQQLAALAFRNRRSVRKLRTMQATAVLMVVMLFLVARSENTVAQSPPRVQAPFTVVDAKGNPLIQMVEPGDLGGGIYVHNAAGNIASTIGFLPGTPGGRVAVYKGDLPGGTTSSFGSLLFDAEGPKLVLQSNDGVGLFIDPRTITLNNKGTQPGIMARLQPDGSGQIRFNDPKGQLALAMTVLQNGVGAVMAGPQFGLSMTDPGLSKADLPWALIGKKSRR